MTHPSVFYKYLTADTALKVLEGGRLRWSSPLLFNDLAEFQRMPRFEPSLDSALAQIPSVYADAAFDLRTLDEERLTETSRALLAGTRMLRAKGVSREDVVNGLSGALEGGDALFEARLRKRFEDFDVGSARVLCLTTEPDNAAMWANYAGSSSGCVIGLQRADEDDSPLRIAQPVTYSALSPVVGSGLDFLLYGGPPDLTALTLDAVCFNKSDVWAYEREWRIMTWRPNEAPALFGDYPFDAREIDSLTFGPRAAAAVEEELIGCLATKYPQAKIYRLTIDRGHTRRVQK